VVRNDTDHSYFWTGLKADGIAAQRAWVWVNFTRGNQCLFMDTYLDPSHDLGRNNSAGGRPDTYWRPLRMALGQTRAYALRMNLAAMVPHDELASTKHCLADPGREYLLYLPDGGDAVVDLSMGSGPFRLEWTHPADGRITTVSGIAGGAERSVRAPFSGDAVLYIVKVTNGKAKKIRPSQVHQLRRDALAPSLDGDPCVHPGKKPFAVQLAGGEAQEN
jgi:hypothetical protein